MASKDPRKFDDLERRLETLRQRHGGGKSKNENGAAGSSNQGFGHALRMSSEFISAILVGALIGYLIDTFAGTTPWGMIVFLLLGFVAGVVNVLRATGQIANPYAGGWARGEKSRPRQRTGNGGQEE